MQHRAAIRRFALVLFTMLVCGPCFAQGNGAVAGGLRIVAPISGAVVKPGQVLQIVMHQSKGLKSSYFDETIGLMPSPLFGEQRPVSLDPYTVQVTIGNPGPGQYAVIGIGRRTGEAQYTQTLPVYVVIEGNPVASIAFASSGVELWFPGETVSLALEAKDASGRFVRLPNSPAVTWSIDDSAVATVDGLGKVTGKTEGVARVIAQFQSLRAGINISVRKPTVRGDLNGDNVVNIADVTIMQLALNLAVQVAGDPRDLNGDGKIDAADLRLLTLLCTRPRCATE